MTETDQTKANTAMLALFGAVAVSVIGAVVGGLLTWGVKLDDRVHDISREAVTREELETRLIRIEDKIDRLLTGAR